MLSCPVSQTDRHFLFEEDRQFVSVGDINEETLKKYQARAEMLDLAVAHSNIQRAA